MQLFQYQKARMTPGLNNPEGMNDIVASVDEEAICTP
jgi:hypothetical protein